jgi:hypothetical protein
MTYATYDEVIERYPALARIASTPTRMNSGFIHYAEQELNGRLSSKFTVPFSEAYPTIKDLAIDLTYYRFLLVNEPDKAKAFHDHIISRIDNIKAGKEYIMTASGTIYAQGGGTDIWSTTMDYHPTHSMHDAESAYSLVSSDRLYDEEAVRE